MDASIISNLKRQFKGILPGRAAQLKMAPSFRPAKFKNEGAIKAGVLLLLYPHPNDLHIVFMKRPVYQGVHSGQISFPGGKLDLTDHSITATALREAKEEIGVLPADIQIIGSLTPLYIPVSETEVYPIVGYCKQRPDFIIDSKEVEFIIEEPVAELLNPKNQGIKNISNEKYTGTVPCYIVKGNQIWGATAMILCEFLEIVRLV